MLEIDWLRCKNPNEMLSFLKDKISGRELRLLSIAFAREVDYLLKEEHILCLDASELFSDGLITHKELSKVKAKVRNINTSNFSSAKTSAIQAVKATMQVAFPKAKHNEIRDTTWDAVHRSMINAQRALLSTTTKKESVLKSQVLLIKDITGNFFDPYVLSKRTWSVTKNNMLLTKIKKIYNEKRFQDMPKLASFLERIGFKGKEVIAHLNGPGPHVKGCKVLDLLFSYKYYW